MDLGEKQLDFIEQSLIALLYVMNKQSMRATPIQRYSGYYPQNMSARLRDFSKKFFPCYPQSPILVMSDYLQKKMTLDEIQILLHHKHINGCLLSQEIAKCEILSYSSLGYSRVGKIEKDEFSYAFNEFRVPGFMWSRFTPVRKFPHPYIIPTDIPLKNPKYLLHLRSIGEDGYEQYQREPFQFDMHEFPLIPIHPRHDNTYVGTALRPIPYRQFCRALWLECVRQIVVTEKVNQFWQLQIRYGPRSVCFPGTEEDLKTLAALRHGPTAASGRKRPILHMVEAHLRNIGKAEPNFIPVHEHLRGLETFEIDGLSFAFVNPQKPQRAVA